MPAQAQQGQRRGPGGFGRFAGQQPQQVGQQLFHSGPQQAGGLGRNGCGLARQRLLQPRKDSGRERAEPKKQPGCVAPAVRLAWIQRAVDQSQDIRVFRIETGQDPSCSIPGVLVGQQRPD